MITFKDWLELNEMGTSTSCIAGFSRIAIPLVTRWYPPAITMEINPPDDDEHKKKRKRKKKDD